MKIGKFQPRVAYKSVAFKIKSVYLLEIEFDLKTKEEAEENPVGKKRAEPEPLDPPNRPSRFQFLGPLTMLRWMIWEPCKWNLAKCLCCLLIILFCGLFLYTSPGYIVKKVLGA